MDGLDKLKYLNAQMAFEAAEDQPPTGNPYLETNRKCSQEIFVHPAVLPNGKRIKLLKTQLTSVCERDCNYCSFRAGRDFRRATFRPEEFARLFIMLTENGIAEGTFLSSGIAGGGVQSEARRYCPCGGGVR